MRSGTSGAKDGDGGRVGGARAEFVASLGRKVNDARELLAMLEEDGASKSSREELRRRLHALGAGARLLRLDAMTQALQQALAVLDRSAQAAGLSEEDLRFLAQVLDDLPALAWGEVPAREAKRGSDVAPEASAMTPIAVLIVGGEAHAAALNESSSTRDRSVEVERTEDPDAAVELARAFAPDILLVDVDLPRAPELVEALLADPLSDPAPVIVVGTLRLPEEISRFDALGVARTLAKPVTAEQLRATCDEIIEIREGRTVRMTLGEPTLEQLADKLADELKHALCDSVDRPARSQRLPLGEGTEVVGALWGAIARVQEIIMEKTGGTIRFGGHAPEGAIALAPSLHQDVPGADRLRGRGRGAAADVRLNGRRIVVADDDPGVTWFISDLLRTAGCEVHEALDGATALDLAFRVQPELVVSDILMPRLDGFALCRALHRDVALRDTPVILLSWKEDLLQRVRELGASAAAYMRKESGSRTILARVREVLWPRARVEARLRGEGEVRGRLDGLTPRLLLELACLIRKNSRVAIGDASHLYEVEIRDGTPRKATRTAADGSFLRGERALATLLGVGAGRFTVATSSESVHGELTGALFDQLLAPIAAARGALAATTGAKMASVERIFFDEKGLEDYLPATPEPTASLIKRLVQGASPRRVLLEGHAAASLLEDLLSDLAARAAIQGVVGAHEVDLLTPAVEAALAVLRRAAEPKHTLPPNARSSAPSPPQPPPVSAPPDPAAVVKSPTVEGDRRKSEAVAPIEARAPTAEENEVAPSSLEDAVMRELSGRSLETRSSRASIPDPPPIVEPSELRARSSNPPTPEGEFDGDDAPPLPSIPPDAIVPAASVSEDVLAAPPVSDHPSAPKIPAPPPPIPKRTPPPAESVAKSAPLGTKAGAPARRGGWGVLLIAALLGIAVVAALRASRREPEPTYVPPEPVASGPTPAPSSETPAVPAASSSSADDLPPGAEVAPGFGLVQVRATPRAVVRIDGAAAGTGSFVAAVAKPGYHEVRVEQGGRTTTHTIEVRAGKATQVQSVPPP